MRYNIIDTTSSSATEARKLFKEHWDNVISTIERFLTSSPDATQLASASASVSASSDQDTDQDTEQDTYQDTEQDGKAKEAEQYLTKISKNVVGSIIFKGIDLIFVESLVVLIQIVYFIRIMQRSCVKLSRESVQSCEQMIMLNGKGGH